MRIVPVNLQCQCGGYMVRFVNTIAFTLTEEEEIVFQGVCNKCGQPFPVHISVAKLWLDCPKQHSTN
jgi:hypothetical protein